MKIDYLLPQLGTRFLLTVGLFIGSAISAAEYSAGGTDTSVYADSDNWNGVTPDSTADLLVNVGGETDLTVSSATQGTQNLTIQQGTTNLNLTSGANLLLNTATSSDLSGSITTESGATLNLSGDGGLTASVLEGSGSTNLSVTATFTGGDDPHPTRDGSTSRYGLVVSADGTVTLQSGADVTVSQTDLNVGIRVGEGTPGTGTLTIESGAQLTVGNQSDFAETGLTGNGFFHAGDWGSTGVVNQTGGSVELLDGSFNLGNQGGHGTYNLSDGTVTLLGGLHSLGRNTGNRAAGSGTINLSGGEFILQQSNVNDAGTFVLGDRDDSDTDGSGVIDQTGGVFRVDAGTNFYLGGYGASTYDLSGGRLEVGGNSLKGNYGSATTDYAFNLQGGAIQVIGSNLNSSVDINLLSVDETPTASIFDTNGFNATLSGDIIGDGALLKQGAGTLSVSGSTRSMAYLSVEDGGFTHASGTTDLGALLIGSYPTTGSDSDGTFTLTNGIVNMAGAVYIGSGDSGENMGVLNIDGGVLNLGDAGDAALRVDFYGGAFGSTGSATVNQTGGVVNKLSDLGVFHIGNQSTAIYNLSGGTINIMGDNGMVLGRSGSSGDGDGTLNVSGGELIFTEGTDLVLGGAQDSEPMTGSGTVNQTGGVVSLRDGGNLVLGQQGDGTYNLLGGTLEVGGTNRIRAEAGNADFTFGGGTLKVIGSNFSSSMDFDVEDIEAVDTSSFIDTNGFDATFSSSLSGDGTIVKLGLGTMFTSGSSNSLDELSVEGGEVEQLSGTTTVSRLLVGAEPETGTDSLGTFTLTDGILNVNAADGALLVGSGNSGANTGVLNIDGGILNLGDAGDASIRVDFYGGGFGSTGGATITQTAGIVNKLSDLGVFHIGNQATGVYNLSGGTLNIMGDNGMVLGRSGTWGDGDGTLNVSGGELIFTEGTDLLLGGAQDSEPLTGSGVINQTDGLVALRDGGSLVLGQRGSGTYNLDGGVLEIGGLNRLRSGNGGAAAFNMGGGTLKFTADSSIGSGVNPNMKSGTTSTIDTNEYNVSVSGLSGSGDWIKKGTGRLSILATGSLSGSTEVQEGELDVQGSLSGSALNVNVGAKLIGTGSIDASSTIAGILSPGDSAGVITFNDGLSLEATSSTHIEIFSNTSTGRGTNFDGIDVSGAFSVSDGATFSIILNADGSTVDFSDNFWLEDQSWLIVDGDEMPNVGETILITASEDSQGNSFTAAIGTFAFVVDGADYLLSYTAAMVPEPSSFALIGGLLALGCTLCRRRRT